MNSSLSSEERKAVLAQFLVELRAEFPRFQIIKKESSVLSHLISGFLKMITFGGMKEYMTRYYTVIGDRLYVPKGFDHFDPIDVVITLRHERVHLRQRRRFTFLGMTLIYLMLPLPLGLAYGRARIEWEAYSETLQAVYDLLGEEALKDQGRRERIISQFTGPSYGWMWPFKSVLDRWYDEAVAKILAKGRAEPKEIAPKR